MFLKNILESSRKKYSNYIELCSSSVKKNANMFLSLIIDSSHICIEWIYFFSLQKKRFWILHVWITFKLDLLALNS